MIEAQGVVLVLIEGSDEVTSLVKKKKKKKQVEVWYKYHATLTGAGTYQQKARAHNVASHSLAHGLKQAATANTWSRK